MSYTHAPTPDIAGIRHLYPFAQQYVHVPGGRLHYLDEGSGPAILMLHGNPTWSFMYRRLVLALRERFRVIVPDHMGCGLSDKPQGYSYRLADHIENISRLVQHLGLTDAGLVVHDWGGAIGMGYAVRQELPIRQIAVFNTSAFLSRNVPKRIAVCKLPGVGDVAIRGLNGFAGAAVHLAVARPLDADVKAGFLLPYRSYRDRVANLRFVQDIPLHAGHPTWQTVQAIDDKLHLFRDTPMEIMWGGRDWCFDDSFLRGWMRRFPHANVVRYDDASHYVLEDAHEAIVPRVQSFFVA